MNKKIKVIDLLNKIANGEDLPKRIKIQEYVFELSKDYEHYYNEYVEITHLINHNFSNLNDYVEILEDNTEEIEGLKYEKYYEEMEEVNKKFIAVDKIKAKIEEINKEMLNEENSLELFYRKKYCKEVLQSLLEKE